MCVLQLESTAVHWACRGGSLPALQLLLDQGAKLTYRDKVRTKRSVFYSIPRGSKHKSHSWVRHGSTCTETVLLFLHVQEHKQPHRKHRTSVDVSDFTTWYQTSSDSEGRKAVCWSWHYETVHGHSTQILSWLNSGSRNRINLADILSSCRPATLVG